MNKTDIKVTNERMTQDSYESHVNQGIMPGGCYGPESGMIGLPNPIIEIGTEQADFVKMHDVLQKHPSGQFHQYSLGAGDDVYDFRSVNGDELKNTYVKIYDQEGTNSAIIQHQPTQLDTINVSYNPNTNRVDIVYDENNTVSFNHGDVKNIAVMHENMRFRQELLVWKLNENTGAMDYFDTRTETFISDVPTAVTLTSNTEMMAKADASKQSLVTQERPTTLGLTSK